MLYCNEGLSGELYFFKNSEGSPFKGTGLPD
jgi:hypothetical protein